MGVQQVRMTDLTAILKLMTRKCGSIEVLQSYETPRPVTGIALPFSYLTARHQINAGEMGKR
jgi:hypothetical protein